MHKFLTYMRRCPQARAQIIGGENYKEIKGEMLFYTTPYGVLVTASLTGLPNNSFCQKRIFGFHIHEGDSCTGNAQDEFANTGMHYNPSNYPHPYHAGDLPPIFSANGCAFTAFLTDRFEVSEIVGRTVIIHSMPDDFTTQPSGNAGTKIACGRIKN